MAYNPTALGEYSVSGDGANFFRIYNITSFSMSGGDREEETTDTLDEASTVSVGPARPKDVSIQCNVNPGTEGWRILFDGYKAAKKVTLKIATQAQKIADNATAANKLGAATTGAVTAAGVKLTEDSNFQVGRGVRFDGSDKTIYTIESIDSDTAMTISPKPKSAIASTADWELHDFGVQWQFECEVLSAGNIDASPGSPMTETFTLKQTGAPADPTLVAGS